MMTRFRKSIMTCLFAALVVLVGLAFTALATGVIEWSAWNKLQQCILEWNLVAVQSLDQPTNKPENNPNVRTEQGQPAAELPRTTIPAYPRLSELGIDTRRISSINCSKSLAWQTIVRASSEINASADLVITFLQDGKITTPQGNPNHFIHDVWNGVMFLAVNCVDFYNQPSRSVSIPHLGMVSVMKECRDTFYKADPVWQIQFFESRVGTLVSKTQWWNRNTTVLASHESCSSAHSFGPSLAYMTALLLAGPSGSIKEFDANSAQENVTSSRTEHWIIRHEDRAIFRSHLVYSTYTYQGLKKAFDVFRNLTYHYILGSDKNPAELGIRPVDREMCRVVLYDRSEEKLGHTRIWEDSKQIQLQLQLKFPHSHIVLLTALPSRLADQVLLFSGLDVFITVHGGWEPNTMFLCPPLEDKIVIESPKECSKPGMDRWWMQRFRNILGFRLLEVPCRVGSSKNHQVLADSLPAMQNELGSRGCQ